MQGSHTRIHFDNDFRGDLFRGLVQAMLHAIRLGNLPADEDWLHRLDGMRKAVMRDLVCHGPDVSSGIAQGIYRSACALCREGQAQRIKRPFS